MEEFGELEINEPHRLQLRKRLKSRILTRSVACIVENPCHIGNLGAIIRSAESLGISKIYVIDGYNLVPNKYKKSQTLNGLTVGSVKWVYIKTFKTTEECVSYLSEHGYTSVVTSPHVKGKDNVNLQDGSYTYPKIAVWFGNESRGISETAVESADKCIQIPMYGMVESFNLSVSAGIVLNTIVSKRKNYKV